MARSKVISKRLGRQVSLVVVLTAVLESPVGTAPVSGLGKEVCAQCGPGTYLKAENNCMMCLSCTPSPISGSRKKVINNCTEYSDTEIGCEEGTFRQDQPMGMFGCMTCTKCADDEVQTRPCTESHNRLCEKNTSKGNYLTKAAPTATPNGTVNNSLASTPETETYSYRPNCDDSKDVMIYIVVVGILVSIVVIQLGVIVFMWIRYRKHPCGMCTHNNDQHGLQKSREWQKSDVNAETPATDALDALAVGDG